MKKLVVIALFLSTQVTADLTGFITLQTEHYMDDALYENQQEKDISVSIQRKYTTSWNQGDDIFTGQIFARIGSLDEEKNHMDIRELNWLHLAGDYEFKIGIDTVFWGVTESQNLVDVINQKDAIEGINNEHKLGQPMLHFTVVKDWGVIDSFALFGFRERTFSGEQGRPRTPIVVATDNVLYQSKDGDKHIDYAIRYSHYYADIDYSISLFRGTQRTPILKQVTINSAMVLQPTYVQITQIGVEAQTIIDAWLLKLETILVDSKNEDYTALTTGFEYTFYGVADSSADVGTIVEYLYDSRGKNAPTPFNRDLFLGARLTFNDIQSSTVLAGMIIDTKNQTHLWRIEGERRLGDDWKISGEVLLYGNISNNDIFYANRNDNALKLELRHYF